MKRKIGTALIGTVVLALGAGVGSVIVTQSAAGAARTTTGMHLVLQGHATLSTVGKGLFDLKLRSAVSGNAKLTNRFAITSITISQVSGSQAIQVSIYASNCDNTNGYGGLEDVVVPQDDTVHLAFPGAVRAPWVAATPASYCLYAQSVRDNGVLQVMVVGTTV